MIASMPQGLAHFAGAATAIAINALWEGALLVVCIWLLLRAWPRINAATRYIVWSATLVATVVVPIATTLPFLTPSSPTAVTEAAVRVPIPMVTHALTAVPSHTTPAQSRASGSAAATRSGEAAPGAYAVPRLPERFRMTLPLPVILAVLAIWTGLALFAFLRLAIGLYRLEQLKRDALPLPVEYRDAMARWTSAGKGGRDVRLCVSDEIDVPVAVGLFDAMILIPRSLLERLSESEVDQISLHELAHLRRADDWTNGLQRVVTALFGWSPAVLFVGQQLDLEREVACDDWVLASTGLVRPYATCLAKMAETSAWPYRPMAAPGVFATRKHISLRIERLLGAGRNAATSLSLGPAAVTVAVVGALAFAMQLVAPSVAAPLQAQPAVRQVTVVAVQREPVPAKTVHAVPKQGSPAQAVTPAPIVRTETKTKEIYKYIRVLAAVSPGPLTSAHPAVHVHMQGMKMQIPPIDVHVPRQTILIPPVDVDVPAIEHAFASGAFAMPSKFASASARAAMAVAAPHPSIRIADNAPVHNCSGCDMSGVNWSGRDMHGVNFTGSDLSRANLSGTNFSNGTFNGVDFTGANLRGANFRGAKLTGCDFSRADLTGVDFTGATLTGCDFTRAQLPSSEARSILNTCTGCDFGGANLSNLDLSHVRVNGVDFTHANLTNTNFTGAKFTGVDFSGARLGGATLKGAVFSGCDMSGVDLNHVDLSDVQFIGTDFPGNPKP